MRRRLDSRREAHGNGPTSIMTAGTVPMTPASEPRRRRGHRALLRPLRLVAVVARVAGPPAAAAASWSSWLAPSSSGGGADDAPVTAAAEDFDDDLSLVSPLPDRRLAARVAARAWPTTAHSAYCEALAYLRDDAAATFAYLDRLAESTPVAGAAMSQADAAAAVALEAAAAATGSDSALLELHLAMRAGAPHCELHRGLARQLLLEHRLQPPPGDADGARLLPEGDADLLAVLYPERRLLRGWRALEAVDWDRLSAPAPTVKGNDWRNETLLPGEPVRGGGDDATRDRLVVLYANLGSAAFARGYARLRSAGLPLAVRHLGAVDYEEDPSGAEVTVLQGYGVRLDIRNVEYKVFDDRRAGHGGDEQASLLNASDPALRAPPGFLAGVDVGAPFLAERLATTADDGSSSSRELLSTLWQRHEQGQRQSQIVPPAWQRRQLPLQMTTVVATAPDPLETLEELSQNLPSLASTLVHVRINETVREVATQLEESSAIKAGKLYVNGRIIHFDRPSFNVFELLDTMKEEHAALKQLQEELGPYLTMEQLSEVKQAWIMGEEFLRHIQDGDNEIATSKDTTAPDKGYRVDVARGGKRAILYLNDVEKDRTYMQWPRSVTKMLTNMQYGMPPMVRRNLFTVFAVMDPLQLADNVGLDVAFQLMQNSFPIRLGVLLVDDVDVSTCAEWLADHEHTDSTPCPSATVLSGFSSTEELRKMKGTAQAFYELLASFAKTEGNEGGGAAAYLQYFSSQLQEHIETQGEASMYDLTMMHGTLMEALGISSSQDAQQAAVEILSRSPSDEEGQSYGHALRFAAEKRLKSGMSFLNGKPLPTERQSNAINSIVGEEQRYVFGMIVSGEITDTSPKSVYGHILSGEKVFPKFHPLLIDGPTEAESHIQARHGFNNVSLLTRQLALGDGPKFLVEGVFDFNADGASSSALAFLDVLDSFSSQLSSGETVNIVFRLIPRFDSAINQAICPILFHASLFGTSRLRKILSSSGDTLEGFLKEAEVSHDVKTRVLSDARSNKCGETYADTSLPTSFITANGRMYGLEPGARLTADDLELLLELEMPRARAVSKLLKNASPEAVSRTSSFLARQEEGHTRVHIDRMLSHTKLGATWVAASNPLRLRWSKQELETLKLHICAVVDPATTSAQRLSTILRMLKDHLDVDLTVIMRPEIVIGGDSKIPVTSYYRFVVGAKTLLSDVSPEAYFTNLPTNHILTLQIDVAEPWNVQQSAAVQDTDNLRCSVQSGCSDEAYLGMNSFSIPLHEQTHLTKVEYDLKSLLVFGQCYETTGNAPNGLQLTLSRTPSGIETPHGVGAEVSLDGSLVDPGAISQSVKQIHADTLVMKNVGYWQLQAGPGRWNLDIAANTKGAEIFDIVDGTFNRGRLAVKKDSKNGANKKVIVLNDFVNKGELLIVKRRSGSEKMSLFDESEESNTRNDDDVINVFSLATGHLYERFLKIMMLSVTKRTSARVKFWLFENFLSPSFKSSAQYMAAQIGSEVEFVTYKWPEWLRGQTEKQRIIWGYKILFLDVLFPLNVKKIIYVDADQVLRGDLKELWDLDLEKKPYGYTPFCTSRETTLGYQFWREGFWKQHLRGRPYHISALYVVDLERFRKTHVGDTLRAIYQQLSADPNSLANLDQDLPNYAQHQVPIHSLPQEWLWCESWCSDETKATSKTIDLCNNPLHKEPKVSMAKRIISGPLFNESWVELDAEVEAYEQAYKLAAP